MNRVKGTYDLLGEQLDRYNYFETVARQVLKRYFYEEIKTPIMEHYEVFHRQSEFSDMVQKETYNFLDRSDRKLTLRPEGTAGVIRSYVENKQYAKQGLTKYFYIGPMFRYERPQKGRFRQFHQLGIEAIGEMTPVLDAEVIGLCHDLISNLGLSGVKVLINSIGDDQSRQNYMEALIQYLIPFKDQLSEDSKVRLDKNPLRILDSKIASDQAILVNAPKPLDYLTLEAKTYFEQVMHTLDLFKIPYEVKNTLVRGLDYYQHTVFEIEADIKDFGAQNVLGGGGRYQNLVKELGGPDISGVGFAFGIERLLMALESLQIEIPKTNQLDVFIITMNDKAYEHGLSLLKQLRDHNLAALMELSRKSVKQQLKSAIKESPSWLIFIGEDELEHQTYTIKNTHTEVQKTIKQSDIYHFIRGENNHA